MVRSAWLVMTLLGLIVIAFAAVTLARRGANSEVAAVMFLRSPWASLLHITCGMVTLAGGPLQFLPGLRERYRLLHRGVGMTYAAAALMGGAAALCLAPFSHGGLSTHLAFGELAAGWIVTTVMAVAAIRRRDIVAHRRWMIRSYALTLGAVMLRIWMPLSALAGIPFETAYPVVAWLAWVPNLLVVELWFVRQAPGATSIP